MAGLAMAVAESWAQARMIAFWVAVPNTKKGHKLKLTDIMEIPLIDGKNKATSDQVAKAYKLSQEEIEQWHADAWIPPDEIIDDNSPTT